MGCREQNGSYAYIIPSVEVGQHWLRKDTAWKDICFYAFNVLDSIAEHVKGLSI